MTYDSRNNGKPFEVSGFDLFSEDESDVEGRVEVIDTEVHKTNTSSRANRAAKRAKTPASTSAAKTRKRKSPSKIQEEKDLILKCCKICYPDSTELGEKIAPGIFDREMSKHRNQKHNIQGLGHSRVIQGSLMANTIVNPLQTIIILMLKWKKKRKSISSLRSIMNFVENVTRCAAS